MCVRAHLCVCECTICIITTTFDYFDINKDLMLHILACSIKLRYINIAENVSDLIVPRLHVVKMSSVPIIGGIITNSVKALINLHAYLVINNSTSIALCYKKKISGLSDNSPSW